MIFTLFYMYATLLQWWRLGTLKHKLNGTLNTKNALLVCDETVIYDTKKSRSFENLLFRCDDRIGCTIVPKQKVNLSQWAIFPRDYRYFPILFKNNTPKIASPSIYILIETMLDTYLKHSADILQVENFGELIAWRASDYFEAILKTDIDKLTKLVHCFSQGDIDINHELKLLKIETVDVEGIPTRIKYDRKYSTESVLKYSHAPVHWKKFAENLQEMYSKMRDITNPKITIENGKSDDIKKVPVSEVKPIKKDSKKVEDKNTLEVTTGDYRRHKSSDHKRDKHSKSDGNVKLENKVKDEHKHKVGRSDKDGNTKEEHKKDVREAKGHKRDVKNEDEARDESRNAKVRKNEDDPAKTETKETKDRKGDEKDAENKSKNNTVVDGNATKSDKPKSKKDEPRSSRDKTEERTSKRETSNTRKEVEKSHKRDEKSLISPRAARLKAGLEKASRSAEKSKMSKRTSSSEKKLVKGTAVCEDDPEKVTKKDDREKQKQNSSMPDHGETNGNYAKVDKEAKSNEALSGLPKNVKPPNILIYADSLVAKDNVKAALVSMLNKDKYTIYDLPTDPSQLMWNSSTVLVVICGTVPPNLTGHLLQYLLNGGQLLCLCSDFLYSVLHTFTTAEVREHELVRFTYGKWKQVKMMHHIFCYQASPAKKQFSKDSDHSNQSSNGSSPIAPRTPSAVEIQHNGKDYVIQVQVLGTEETWQTPSLLLATVKGGEGRAIFSQVHLEIDPNEYEDDEKKFEALKDSDQARLEILGDILSNHLDMDCGSSTGCQVAYTPAYFLGRHDMKLNLLTGCDSVIQHTVKCEKISVKFYLKEEDADPADGAFMPVFVHSCPPNFSTVAYFEALETNHVGRLVLYSDVMTSSQHVLGRKLTHGLGVIARQQTEGMGRSNNVWLSPVGSALFSLQLHIPLDSPLGRVLPFVQQLVTVAVVSAIRSQRGYENLNIGIKWPNDIYANENVKIGGVLVNSSILGDTAIVNVGCGLNLDNPNPTVCVNDLIRTSNREKNTSMKIISYETYFAAVFNEIESIYEIVQSDRDEDYVYQLYYKYWLHTCDTEITVSTAEGTSETVKIVGIDDVGYLRVRGQNGDIRTVHPDGNTFDMLRGLVSPKVF